MSLDNEQLEKLKKDFKTGMGLKKLCEKHNITINQFKAIRRKYKWKRKNGRSQVQIGNQNAVGNKGGIGPPPGTKNALKTGLHEKVRSF